MFWYFFDSKVTVEQSVSSCRTWQIAGVISRLLSHR